MKRFVPFLTLIAAFSGMAAAQGPGYGRGKMAGSSALDLSRTQTIAGTVTAVNLGYGFEYPSITVNQKQIKLAPVWYLLDKGFEVKAGDSVTALAAPSTLATDSYLYAIQITNATNRLSLTLRDTAGVPLWSAAAGQGMRGGHGSPNGPMSTGAGCDASTIASASGTIVSVTMGAGIQMPSLTLKTAAGDLLVVKLGPERLLAAADLELKPGDSISVKYAECPTGELIALSFTFSGQTVTLREDDCRPAW
ncbi:MAG: hypothetical protein KGN36_15760 [Acidobacteriota bacterium]|nr:hypothetical protein [Acidobacteriota bacterium]